MLGSNIVAEQALAGTESGRTDFPIDGSSGYRDCFSSHKLQFVVAFLHSTAHLSSCVTMELHHFADITLPVNINGQSKRYK